MSLCRSLVHCVSCWHIANEWQVVLSHQLPHHQAYVCRRITIVWCIRVQCIIFHFFDFSFFRNRFSQFHYFFHIFFSRFKFVCKAAQLNNDSKVYVSTRRNQFLRLASVGSLTGLFSAMMMMMIMLLSVLLLLVVVVAAGLVVILPNCTS